ncbi:hypothetical protein N374_gp056 [Bacillus phage phiNIT1]|uniref:Uncharacterized protein n=1 Tax=Bacillus phage phiNIT1 TaxID=207656 RepID=S6B6D5_9CAUD|nr:hypothetical protein N374_gp056 [Bacillus phage phiNIT1]AYJ75399.1 hypothetical protein BSP21_064 [Bacillus phage BSP21]BAN59652.1 hypothetical protein [Bacillus phage phiNIT1]
MEKTYKVEVDITQRFTTTVTVTGDFKDANDPRIDKAAEQEADRMNHGAWDWQDSEFEIMNVKEVSKEE